MSRMAVAEALNEVARFLAMRPPFDGVAPDELCEVAAETELEFYTAGSTILSEDGGPVTFLRVIHSGAVDVVHGGRLLDLLGPGDALGQGPMLSGLPPGFDARAAEDTLCYRIPVAVARPLLDRAKTRELTVGVHEPAHQPVGRLIRLPTVLVKPTDSIREVARRMSEAGADAAMVDLGDDGFGIVTDSDIRSKVVAADAPLSTPVADAMTGPLYTVTPDRPGGEVLFEMLERGIRHAPVVNERGHLLGLVEDGDLFAVQPRSWFGVRRSIARTSTIEALGEYARRLPQVAADLHASNLRASEVARVLSALTDSVTVRALELVGNQFELPRDGLVWVAVGSQARRETTPGSTARGAVVCSETPPPGWSEAASAALATCGLTAGLTARSAREWCELHSEDELALAVLVERRPLWGTPREKLPAPDGQVRDRVLAALADRALAYTPPTGFDAEAVLEADGTRSERLDIRRAAVIPIVELARWAGAAANLVEGSTPERLRIAGEEGVLPLSDARSLIEAFELALELRIAHHVDQLRAGANPDDWIDPASIGPLTKDHLRDVFRAVTAVQRRLRR
jgi:CBS domain-containing protein